MARKPAKKAAAKPAAKTKAKAKTVAKAKPAAKAKAKVAKPAKAAKPAKVAKVAAPAKPKPLKVSHEAGKTIPQGQLMAIVAEQLMLPKAQAKSLVDGFFEIVKAHILKGVKVKLGDIGTLSVRHRKARMARNPRTGEQVKVKASKKLAFRQSATMRDAVK